MSRNKADIHKQVRCSEKSQKFRTIWQIQKQARWSETKASQIHTNKSDKIRTDNYKKIGRRGDPQVPAAHFPFSVSTLRQSKVNKHALPGLPIEEIISRLDVSMQQAILVHAPQCNKKISVHKLRIQACLGVANCVDVLQCQTKIYMHDWRSVLHDLVTFASKRSPSRRRHTKKAHADVSKTRAWRRFEHRTECRTQ